MDIVLAVIITLTAFVVLMPVMVLGTWFLLITALIGMADATFRLLDGGWRRAGRKPDGHESSPSDERSETRRLKAVSPQPAVAEMPPRSSWKAGSI
ncbi:hypothetical protein [Candidatus Nitrospira bockiana]